jgi:Meckel syndrome type 1 protein
MESIAILSGTIPISVPPAMPVPVVAASDVAAATGAPMGFVAAVAQALHRLAGDEAAMPSSGEAPPPGEPLPDIALAGLAVPPAAPAALPIASRPDDMPAVPAAAPTIGQATQATSPPLAASPERTPPGASPEPAQPPPARPSGAPAPSGGLTTPAPAGGTAPGRVTEAPAHPARTPSPSSALPARVRAHPAGPAADRETVQPTPAAPIGAVEPGAPAAPVTPQSPRRGDGRTEPAAPSVHGAALDASAAIDPPRPSAEAAALVWPEPSSAAPDAPSAAAMEPMRDVLPRGEPRTPDPPVALPEAALRPPPDAPALPPPPAEHTLAAAVRPPAPLVWPARQVAPFAVALALGPDASVTLTLEPAELGQVEISIERQGETASVRVVAERPETLALLQRDGRELERALHAVGLGERGTTLSFTLSGEAGGGAMRDPERREDRSGAAPQPLAPASAATQAAAPRAQRGLIDLAV